MQQQNAGSSGGAKNFGQPEPKKEEPKPNVANFWNFDIPKQEPKMTQPQADQKMANPFS